MLRLFRLKVPKTIPAMIAAIVSGKGFPKCIIQYGITITKTARYPKRIFRPCVMNPRKKNSTPINWKKFEKFVLFIGCRLEREKGDHRVYWRSDLKRPVIIPRYKNLPVFIIRNNLREAVKKVPISKELTIMVNWEDLEYIKEIKDKLIAEINGVEKIEIIENSNIDKGGCIIETSMGTIDASINSQLELIYEQFMEILSNSNCNKTGCELEVKE